VTRVKKYLVVVYGRNFRLKWLEGRNTVVKVTGFHTTRCVVAPDPVKAEYKAIAMIRDDHKLKASVTNARTDPPIMYVSDIREVASFAPFKPPGGGYAFFHGKGAGRPRSTTPNRSRRKAGQ
jgi:hypothetical protein